MEKPILFNTEMVQAILEGRKTSTRRIIKKPYEIHELNNCIWVTHPKNFKDEYCRFVPYESPYTIGDIIYVRETWRKQPVGDGHVEIQYKADFDETELSCYGKRGGYAPAKWHPSIHMPKEAARIFLKVTNVRVQKLQDITEEEAKAEGATKEIWYQPYGTKSESNQKYVGDIIHQEINYRTGFAGIWDRTLGKKTDWMYSFSENPWVWVIEFERS